MDNVELSPATRWGMIATGLLQGLVCYLLIAWLAGKNLSWIVYGVPATVAFSSTVTIQYRCPVLPMIWFSSISARKGYASSMAWSAAVVLACAVVGTTATACAWPGPAVEPIRVTMAATARLRRVEVGVSAPDRRKRLE